MALPVTAIHAAQCGRNAALIAMVNQGTERRGSLGSLVLILLSCRDCNYTTVAQEMSE